MNSKSLSQSWGSIALAVSVISVVATSSASACSDLPNICEQHQQVHNWNMERAREAAQDYADSQEGARQRRIELGREARELPDKTQVLLDLTLAMVKSAKNTIEASERMAKDPHYAWVKKGKWEFFQDSHVKKPGEFCAAMFINMDGAVRLSGPGGSYNGALLTFWGPNIPRPSALRTIKVSLTQSDDGQTQTVDAFNYTDHSDKYEYGVIAFAVPSTDALLANMKDTLGFQLNVNGKSALNINWHSGLIARDKLRQCTTKRG